MGGSSNPVINLPSNLLVLCGSATSRGGCHAYVESNRTEAKAMGWLLKDGQNATEVPVLVHGLWVLLDDAGRSQPTTPPDCPKESK